MIPESFIQDLLNRVDVVDVVGRYVQLKKAGANLQGLCPFHNEKSPSFSVSPTKQFYHCFGCGAHGTAIGFLMEYAGMGFIDTVKDLAQGAGMTVPEANMDAARPATSAPYETLYEWTARTAAYYQARLKEDERAKAYVNKRGLTRRVGDIFQIGYAPDAWDSLKDVFGETYEVQVPIELGLVIDKEASETVRAKRYDRFRDRIMFPIRNTKGQIIGFGGRILDQGEPKYLNSPETVLFEKGKELYGLFEARKAIRAAQKVLVVEGYMDVVALAQHGVEYAVATLGTACTPMHVQKLLKQADEIIFAFDGDKAGQRAAWRALENALPIVQDGHIFKFLFLPEEHDPDSYVREFGKEGFERAVQAAMPLSRFLVTHLSAEVDLTTAEGRSRLVNEAKQHVTRIAAPVLRVQIVRLLAEAVEMDVPSLAGLFGIDLNISASTKNQFHGASSGTGMGPNTGEPLWQSGKNRFSKKPLFAGSRAPRKAPVGLQEWLIRYVLEVPALSRDPELDAVRQLVSFDAPLADLLDYCDHTEDKALTPAVLARFSEMSPNARTYIGAFEHATLMALEPDALQQDFAATLAKFRAAQLEDEIARLIKEGVHTEEQRQQFRVLNDERQRIKRGAAE